MKSQYLILQFILFFIIGFSIFILIGNTFKLQFTMTQSDLTGISLKLTNSYISSAIISMVDSCKMCDNVVVKLDPQKTAADLPYFISLDNGLNVSTDDEYSFSSVHMLSRSINMGPSTVLSKKAISLTFDKTNNILGVFQ